jgi:hypothetical protein
MCHPDEPPNDIQFFAAALVASEEGCVVIGQGEWCGIRLLGLARFILLIIHF